VRVVKAEDTLIAELAAIEQQLKSTQAAKETLSEETLRRFCIASKTPHSTGSTKFKNA